MTTSGGQARSEIVATEPHQLAQRSNSLVSRGLAHLTELARTEQERAAMILAGDIHEAARKGDLLAVRTILERNPAKARGRDEHGRTPLRRAVVRGHTEVVEYLLGAGADPHAKDDSGCTALHCATRKCNSGMITVLVEAGCDVNAESDSGTPLCEAVWNGAEKAIELLLLNGANVNAPTNRDTPLHIAVSNGQTSLVRLLLAKGAFVEARDKGGATPLHAAGNGAMRDCSAYDAKGIVELLLSHGANINSVDDDGKTALHEAVIWGQLAVAKELLCKGAHVNAVTNDGETPLHAAAAFRKEKKWGCWRAVCALVDAMTDDGEAPPASVGIIPDRGTMLEVMKVLLASGGNVNAVSRNGQTPLDLAVEHRLVDSIAFLRQQGGKLAQEMG